jgi:dienelactone hydrolase
MFTMTTLLRTGLCLGHIFSVAAVSFPLPSGQFNTSIKTVQLTDYSRLDPYAPTRQFRTLMVSIFHPSECTASMTPYMDAITAAYLDSEYSQYGIPAGTFEALNLQACSPSGADDVSKSPYPILLFSPGMGDTRLIYSALAQQVSSAGYIVVTVDHPYDADIVTYPDKTFVLAANISTEEQIVQDVGVRVKDVSFVLDQLSVPAIFQSLIPGQPELDINVRKVGIFGHSLGGATAAQAMLLDSRFAGGINLDGTFFGSVIQKGLSNPFLIFAHEGKNTTTDPTWAALWPRLRGWKRELIVAGSSHTSFTDLPNVVEVLGFGNSLPSDATELLGTINGTRASEIITAYAVDFFNFVLKKEKVTLLDGPSGEFPEVTFWTS